MKKNKSKTSFIKSFVIGVTISVFLAFLSIVTASAGTDERSDITITFHNGLILDSFAADEHKTYLNRGSANEIQSRYAFGLDMAYRLLGDSAIEELVSNTSLKNLLNFKWNPQLWVYGTTNHGMRSTELNCDNGENASLSACSSKGATTASPDDNFFILRNSSSLEGFGGLRLEIFTLQPDGDHPANFYINGQLGFLSINDKGGDIVDMHHYGIGATVVGGKYKDSLLEVGLGRTDLFERNRDNRFKVIAKAVWHPERFFWLIPPLQEYGNPAAFIKLVADTDLGPGSDSIQTYLGLTFSIDKCC